MAPQEIDMLAEELEIAEELQEWMVFDLVFGFLVIFNALFIGFEDSYNYEEDATTITSWYIFECYQLKKCLGLESCDARKGIVSRL